MEIGRRKFDAREIVDHENVDHGDRENEGTMLDREIVVHNLRVIVIHDHRDDRSHQSAPLTGSNGPSFSGEIPFKNR